MLLIWGSSLSKSPLKHKCDPQIPSAYGQAEAYEAMQGNLVAHSFPNLPH